MFEINYVISTHCQNSPVNPEFPTNWLQYLLGKIVVGLTFAN